MDEIEELDSSDHSDGEEKLKMNREKDENNGDENNGDGNTGDVNTEVVKRINLNKTNDALLESDVLLPAKGISFQIKDSDEIAEDTSIREKLEEKVTNVNAVEETENDSPMDESKEVFQSKKGNNVSNRKKQNLRNSDTSDSDEELDPAEGIFSVKADLYITNYL